jgi:purine-binding chemotaxis protein CheW
MRQLLPFVVAGEMYALELGDIQEIVENRTLYPFPGVPAVVAGAIAFHGRIVPVVDLFKLLGLGSGILGEWLIVLTNEKGPVALAVEQVLPILNLDGARDQAPGETDASDYVKGFIHTDKLMVALFDLERMGTQIEQLCASAGG